MEIKKLLAERDHSGVAIELDEALGLAVRRIRQYQKMTQIMLARKANVSQAWISLAERAGDTKKNKRPSLEILKRVAHALGLNCLSDLIKLAEEMTNTSKTLREIEQFIVKSE